MEIGSSFLPAPRSLLAFSFLLLSCLLILGQELSGFSLLCVAVNSTSIYPSVSVLGKLPSYFNLTCGQIPVKNPNPQDFNSSLLFAPFLVSKESSFAWGFVTSASDPSDQVSPPTCSLSVVCYNCKSFYVVWSACCDSHGQSLSNSSTLKLGAQRDLQLVDSQGAILWSSNSTNVASIELLETGNLLLVDSHNSIIWQSFLHPSNVLLPGQILTPGMSLRAGDFSASMEQGGLALWVKVSEESLPYLVLNASWSLTEVNAIMKPVCSGLSLAYAADGSTLMMEINLGSKGSVCYNATGTGNTMLRFNQTISTSAVSNGFKYFKLGSHGGLEAYVDGELEFSWFDQGDSDEGRGYCNLPSHCGEFGLCAPGGQCRCPHGLINETDDGYLLATDYSVATPDEDDCPQIQPANCSSASTFQVLKLQDIEYFSHKYMPPPMKNLSLQACLDSCIHNCSCVIAFYNTLSLGCHHYSKALSLQRTTYGGTYLAYIKMATPPADTENPHNSGSTPANHKLNIIAISIIFGTSLVVCLIVFMYVYKHYGTWNDEGSGNGARIRSEDDVFLGSLSGLPPRYTFKEMEQLTNGFNVKLGHGSFGSVYGGTLDDGSRIAVKKLEGTRQGDKEFRAEVASLAGISHVNLVRLRGFCAEGGHRLLVYEYMTNGSLDKWLARGGNLAGTQLDWQQRLKIAIDAARGLAYLHGESRERIFHLDIKPQNILLDEKFVAKLSDFGLSKQLDRARSRTVTSMRGTPGYLAPEWLLQTTVTEKSDVYSFGMVLLELVSGRRNVDYSSVNPDKWFWPAWVVNKAVSHQWPDIREELSSKGWPQPVHEGEKAIKVAFWCLQEDPKSRPSMSTVLLMLEGLVHVADPPLEMRLTLEAQARLLASFHPDHCSSTYNSPPIALPPCFLNSWSFGTGKIPTSAPLASSPPTPCFKPSLSI